MSPIRLKQTLLQNPLVLPLYLPSLVFAISQGVIEPILPLYLLEFEISYWIIGLVLGAEGIGMLLGDIPAGILSRLLGQKRTMLLGVACTAFATVALFWSTTILMVLILRFLAGFSIALFNIARHAYLAEAIALGSRGRAIAGYGGIMRIGKFIGPAIGGLIAGAFGLQAPFLVFGVAGVISLVFIGLFVRPSKASRAESTAPSQPTHRHIHLVSAIRNHAQILSRAGAAQLFAQMIRAGRSAIIPLYAKEIIGLDVESIGLIISIAAAVDMSLFLPAGYVMDNWGRKFSIVPCFFIQAIGMALIPLTGSFTSLLLATITIGFGNGLGSGTMMTLGADLAPQDSSRGEFLGVWRLIGDVGHTGAPMVVGGVANLVGLSMGALALSGAGLIAVMIFAFLVPETLHRKRPTDVQTTPKTAP